MLIRTATALLLGLTLLAPPARADAVSDFYKGKTVTLIVGYGTGGGYDVFARLLARYLGKYIPGNPSVIVQNMPGAGSMRAVNALYNTAPKDGTTIGMFAAPASVAENPCRSMRSKGMKNIAAPSAA